MKNKYKSIEKLSFLVYLSYVFITNHSSPLEETYQHVQQLCIQYFNEKEEDKMMDVDWMPPVGQSDVYIAILGRDRKPTKTALLRKRSPTFHF